MTGLTVRRGSSGRTCPVACHCLHHCCPCWKIVQYWQDKFTYNSNNFKHHNKWLKISLTHGSQYNLTQKWTCQTKTMWLNSTHETTKERKCVTGMEINPQHPKNTASSWMQQRAVIWECWTRRYMSWLTFIRRDAFTENTLFAKGMETRQNFRILVLQIAFAGATCTQECSKRILRRLCLHDFRDLSWKVTKQGKLIVEPTDICLSPPFCRLATEVPDTSRSCLH